MTAPVLSENWLFVKQSGLVGLLRDALDNVRTPNQENDRSSARVRWPDMLKACSGTKRRRSRGLGLVLNFRQPGEIDRPPCQEICCGSTCRWRNGALMRRMDYIYQNRLATWTGHEEDQPAARAELQQQAEVMATLARALQASSYEYADDKEYVASAKTLEQQAKAVAAAAAESTNDATLKVEIQRLQKSCSKCHENFR